MKKLYREDVERAAKKVKHEMVMVERVIKDPRSKAASLEEWKHVIEVLQWVWKRLPSAQSPLSTLGEEKENAKV